ncbi:MAG TPA: hypothetical protein VGD71_25305, partial [Kribbella sp.]
MVTRSSFPAASRRRGCWVPYVADCNARLTAIVGQAPTQEQLVAAGIHRRLDLLIHACGNDLML